MCYFLILVTTCGLNTVSEWLFLMCRSSGTALVHPQERWTSEGGEMADKELLHGDLDREGR